MRHDAAPAASPPVFCYAFDAPLGGAPIVVRSDYAIEPHLSVFLLNWPCRVVDQDAPADIVLRRIGSRIGAYVAARREEELDGINEFDGVNRLADLLSHVAAGRVGGLAELHSSAVSIAGKLALFVGPSLSGKSSLALQLTARGCRLFADDRLLVGPLRDRQTAPFGVALGLTPRVRHPPHPAAGQLFAKFVARHLVKAGGNVGFLPLPADLAHFGEAAALGAVFLPERRDSGGVILRPAGRAAANRVVLEQMHAPQMAAVKFLAAVGDLTAGLPCWHLQYDDSAKAALEVQAAIAG
ncbi:MAG: hypothetical protein ABI439_07750 [Rhodospirillales bacterium]